MNWRLLLASSDLKYVKSIFFSFIILRLGIIITMLLCYIISLKDDCELEAISSSDLQKWQNKIYIFKGFKLV